MKPFDNAHKRGLRLLLLGAVIYALFEYVALTTPTMLGDFMLLYFPSRTLLHHSDPYSAESVLLEYQAQGPSGPDADSVRKIATHLLYPPAGFLLTSPVAMLPLKVARPVWTGLSIASLLLAAVLIWHTGANWSPRLAGFLIAFGLANGETLAWSGNAACTAVALCAIATWCFVRSRWLWVGAGCLAASILLKPTMGGFFWIYFLLAGSIYRRTALRSLLVAIALGIPSVLWVTHVAPEWTRELLANLAFMSRRGGLDDPGPSSGVIPGSMVNLQTIASLLRNEAWFYNSATYLICGVLIGYWAFVTIQSKSAVREAWLALAAISPLTLLVVYHRRYDASLLMLTVPACAMLWARRDRLGRIALAITGACFLFTGDGLWIFSSKILPILWPSHPALFHTLESVLIVYPAPLSLLAMGIFYLWVYAKQAEDHVVSPARIAAVPTEVA